MVENIYVNIELIFETDDRNLSLNKIGFLIEICITVCDVLHFKRSSPQKTSTKTFSSDLLTINIAVAPLFNLSCP